MDMNTRFVLRESVKESETEQVLFLELSYLFYKWESL